MKALYIDLMEKILGAYTHEHILRYFNEVKAVGLTEHGFPRLTANMGILIANGRRSDLLSLFTEMMDFCCKTIPNVKAANDFSVREIINCLEAIEASHILPSEKTESWRAYLGEINPEACYNVYAKAPTDPVRNWALFTGVSEYFRQRAGLCHSEEFIDVQLASQLQWLDENGMYMDTPHSDVHQPIIYDLVPRGLFAILLHAGYRGKHYEEIDSVLKKSGILTLGMQSVSGEAAFGGRSNQFLHNEGWLAVIFEYEANRYKREGDLDLYKKFKSAVSLALENTKYWLNKEPVRHIKNRFPTETSYGCEEYAYFDKYMISAASMLHAAYLISDGEAFPVEYDAEPSVTVTSRYFHKLFMKCGGYALELDTNADPHYDAKGLGRIHKIGAPSGICMSQSCPAHPVYTVDIEPSAVSMCSGVGYDGSWEFAADTEAPIEIISSSKTEASASAALLCRFSNGRSVKEFYTVSEDGVNITAEGEGKIAYMLPAFLFDGEEYTEITLRENTLTVSYGGWLCRYVASAEIFELLRLGAGRNGHYKAFAVSGENRLEIKVEILKI